MNKLLLRPKGNALQHGQPAKARACRCDGIREADHCLKCGRLSAEAIRSAWGGYLCR